MRLKILIRPREWLFNSHVTKRLRQLVWRPCKKSRKS